MRRILKKNLRRELRKRRVRAKIFGTEKRPRLSVFRSNRYIYAQLIDDNNQKTLTATSIKNLKNKSRNKKNKQTAAALGELLAEKAQKLNIKEIVFDRGAYKYHGRIKSLAEAFLNKLNISSKNK